MSIEKVLKNIKADRDELEARLDRLATAASPPGSQQSHPSDDAYSLLSFFVGLELREAAVRLDILGEISQPVSSQDQDREGPAGDVVDLTDYTEDPNGSS